MGRTKKTWKQQTYGHQRALSLKSRLLVLLRDELGLSRQPKVARLLVDEIIDVVESTFVDSNHMKPGQVLLLAPEIGQGPSWRMNKLEDKKLKPLRLDLIDQQDIERIAEGEPLSQVRKQRLVRLVKQAFEQGATLTVCQLAIMSGISRSTVSWQLRAHMQETGEILPTRGIVEDCSPAISHKADIVARHLEGQSTTEIARATSHTPRSVERYIRRFEQVRELVHYIDKELDPTVISRILACSRSLVTAYLNLMPAKDLSTATQKNTNR